MPRRTASSRADRGRRRPRHAAALVARLGRSARRARRRAAPTSSRGCSRSWRAAAICCARPASFATAPRQVTGVVVASDYLSGDLAERSRRMTKAYEDYTQLRVLRQPLAGVYLSFFVMVTLLILVSSTWMGLYLAKRITRPVQLLSVAAREIGAGALRSAHRAPGDRRVRVDDRGLQRHGRGARVEPAAAGARRDRSRTQEPGGGRPAPLHRDDPRARRHRRRFHRSRRAHRHRQLRRDAAARGRRRRRRPAGGGRLRPHRSAGGSTACSTRPRARAPMPSRRRSPSSAKGGSCTWRRRPPASPAPAATTRAPSSCSTT